MKNNKNGRNQASKFQDSESTSRKFGGFLLSIFTKMNVLYINRVGDIA